MKSRVIANPPIGVYTNYKTEINHAVFLIILDTIARYRSTFKDEKVIFPGRSYNFYGKRADIFLALEGYKNYEELSNQYKKIIFSDKIRNKLNLSSLEIILDNDPILIENIQKDFLKIYERNYLVEKNGHFYLNYAKLKKESRLEEALASITIHPKRILKEMERLLKNSRDLILITRETNYSIKNPLGKYNIGPLFVLANLWDHKFPESNFTICCSNNTLTKYALLRYLSRFAIEDKAGMDELFVWPKIIPEEDKEWDLEILLKDEYHADMLRCAILESYTEKSQKAILKKDRFIGARNFVYSILNLRKFFKDKVFKHIQIEKVSRMNNKYRMFLETFDFPLLIQSTRKKLKEISYEINMIKENERFNNLKMSNLLIEYLEIVESLSPLLPATTKLVLEEQI